MKAKEYAAKYDELTGRLPLSEQRRSELSHKLCNELLGEFLDLFKARHIQTKSGLENLKREFNKKANIINELLGKPFKKDWFYIMMNILDGNVPDDKPKKEEVPEDVNEAAPEEH